MPTAPRASRSLTSLISEARSTSLVSRLRRTAHALADRALADRAAPAVRPGFGGAGRCSADGSRWSISSRGSLGSIASLGSLGSIASIGSVGSMASVGSSGSLVSIGSVGSIASIASAGCILSVGSSGKSGAFFGVPVVDLLRRRRGAEPTDGVDDRSLGGGPGEG